MAKLVQLPSFSDERGELTVLEHVLGFEIKRLYWIHGVQEGASRGGHRHKVTRQGMVCISGSCQVKIMNETGVQVVSLKQPTQLLTLEPEDWHEMNAFAPGTVLLLVASHEYMKSDYILEPMPCKSAMKI